MAFAISACSSIPVSQDFEQGFDYSGFKTFAWRAIENNDWGLIENEIVDRRIRNAIANTLTSKQFKLESPDTADFLVSYNVVVEQRITGSNLSGGVSIGRSTRGRFASIGVSSQALPDLSDPQRLTARIIETVKAILEQFPPK